MVETPRVAEVIPATIGSVQNIVVPHYTTTLQHLLYVKVDEREKGDV
jgi:hypothetical protein